MGRSATILELERRIERIEARPRTSRGVVPTGLPSLDTLLPDGGLPRGRVVEWIGTRSSGKTTLLRATFARLRASGESIAVIDPARTLYAPDWTGLVPGEGRFWVVRPPGAEEAAWCVDLILRSGAFGGVALLSAADGSPGLAGHESSLRRGVAVRLQRLAEEASAVFVTLGPVPLAALRLSFRPGRIEAVRGPFGPLLPPVRPIWVRVGKRGGVEIPLLCPMSAPWGPEPARDRKGPAT